MDDKSPSLIPCPTCHKTIQIALKALFCPFCGSPLTGTEMTQTTHEAPFSLSATNVNLVPGHLPQDHQIQGSIGPYQILRKIGQGGMGEVFLAYDTTCGRRIALKKIRSDLLTHKQVHRRFLKEAHITSQLTHPAIIPIYAIHDEKSLVYYTMPYVEGDTLKQILKNARQHERQAEKAEYNEGMIASLIRIFLSICQAVGYAHSKGVLHRDLKPENVIVGKYGEVLILDWGLAKLITKQQVQEDIEEIESQQDQPSHPLHALTKLGKVVGTITYMAPERGLGSQATIQTDIYSLGVILYQILTLRHPFLRKSLKEFRQYMHLETLQDPSLVAPYRDVPRILAQMAMKCLSKEPLQRYKTVDDLLFDLESYIEGRSEWFLAAELTIDRKEDWEFQENVFIAEHIAITHNADISDWVSLMISRASFDQNIKIEVSVKLGKDSHGIGFLVSVPEAGERAYLNDGYTLWLSSEAFRNTKLLRSTVEVFHTSDTVLQADTWYHVCIEKMDRHIYFYLNHQLQFSYLGLLPIVGTHIGLLSRDADYELKDFRVYSGGQNITVNCLAVPDAFLAHKDYITALYEYRRIGYSFPGRAEGREALFRAGITLLEQAKAAKTDQKEDLFELTFKEFEKLHNTPGAPLEYLGKALTYEALQEHEEELKCYELALRRYSEHPLLSVLKEQILCRMHKSSRHDRHLAYCYILLVVRHIPEIISTPPVKKLLDSLEKHWEPLSFIEEDSLSNHHPQIKNYHLAIKIAFWLAKPHVLMEIAETLNQQNLSPTNVANALFCMIELGHAKLVREQLDQFSLDANTKTFLEVGIEANEGSLSKAIERLIQLNPIESSKDLERTSIYLIQKALDEKAIDTLRKLFGFLSTYQNQGDSGIRSWSKEMQKQITFYEIWFALFEKNWRVAGELLHQKSIEELTRETSLLYFLYGCWLAATEGRDIAQAHFSGAFETSHPRSWALFSHFYMGKIEKGKGWYLQAFLWEKKQLYRQAALFHRCETDTSS